MSPRRVHFNAPLSRPFPGEGSDNVELPETIRYRGLSKAWERLDEFIERYRPKALRLLDQPGGKELVLELPGVPIDHAFELFNSLTDGYPIFRPILDVFKRTLTDSVRLQLKRKLDELAGTAIKNPNDMTLFPKAAQEIADTVPIQMPSEVKHEFGSALNDLQRNVTEIRAGSERLEAKVEAAETSRNEPDKSGEQANAGSSTGPLLSELPSELPSRPPPEPAFQPIPEPTGGSIVSGCVCNTYVDGALVSSVRIPVGATCGAQICGR